MSARAPIALPALSPTMARGRVAAWLKVPGERVAAGDALFEVETDKATLEVEADVDGALAEIVVEAGAPDVAVGATVGWLLVDDPIDAPNAVQPESAALAEKPAGVGPAARKIARERGLASARLPASGPKNNVTKADVLAASFVAAPSRAPAGRGRRIVASPYAKKLARQRGVALERLAGSGPGGRIVARDVTARRMAPSALAASTPTAASERAPAPSHAAPRAPAQREPLSPMRKAIAKRLSWAKQNIPHFYLAADCRMDAAMRLRRELNESGVGDIDVTLNDLIVKAAALAIRAQPSLNTRYDDGDLLRLSTIDVAIAVALPNGLVTPIVEDADQKSIFAIAAATKRLAQAARDGALQPSHYEGGSMTISNLGMFGVTNFSAIINPPQAAILTIGSAAPRPVARDGAVAITPVASVGLAADHRIVDGAAAALWLDAFRDLIEKPLRLALL